MKVREAVLADAQAIRAIYNDAVATTTATMDTRPRSLEQQERWLKGHNGKPYSVYIAEGDNDTILGWAALSSFNPKPGYNPTAEVSVYIHRDWRGHKIGTALLQALMDDAAQKGFSSLVALITTGNSASLRLHEAQGFENTGTLRRVAKKFNTWVDVTFLQKRFDLPESETGDDNEASGAATS